MTTETETNTETEKNFIRKLIKEAGEAAKPDDAMKFAQAALNAANALAVMQTDVGNRSPRR